MINDPSLNASTSLVGTNETAYDLLIQRNVKSVKGMDVLQKSIAKPIIRNIKFCIQKSE